MDWTRFEIADPPLLIGYEFKSRSPRILRLFFYAYSLFIKLMR